MINPLMYRSAFLLAHIPLYLYPFLHTVSKTRPFEYLRLTSLGVIGALVKTDEQDQKWKRKKVLGKLNFSYMSSTLGHNPVTIRSLLSN